MSFQDGPSIGCDQGRHAAAPNDPRPTLEAGSDCSEAANGVDAANCRDPQRVDGDRPSGWPMSERSRERLDRLGPTALSDADLIALVLRSGDARRDVVATARLVLDRFGSPRGLADESCASLIDVPGLGPAKAASLVGAIELGRRSAAQPMVRGKRIQSPLDVQRHFQPRLREWRRESFHVLLLDGRHRLIALETVSLGTLTASLVHPREVFREAIRRAAAAMILVHNHPSGDPSPSQEDRDVTRRLESAGDLLGIRVLDHVIVAEGGYFSFREETPEPGLTDDGRDPMPGGAQRRESER